MPCLPQANWTSLTISNSDEALSTDEPACDLGSLRFIDAYGLVALACALEAGKLDTPGLKVVPPKHASTRSHLGTMGFDDFLDGMAIPRMSDSQNRAKDSSVVVPLAKAPNSTGEQPVINLLWEQLSDQVSPQTLAALGESVWEMLANAQEHSGADGLVMAQIYTAKRGGEAPDHDDKVQVVIGDTGRGIRASLSQSPNLDPADDVEAIEMALQYLVSSVLDPGRGQGLSTTHEQIAGLGGRMIVRSGGGKVDLTDGGRTATKVPWLPGTIVGLSLPLYPG
jgi:hypothetical protein